MQPNTHRTIAKESVGHDSFRALLKRPAVQILLGVTTVVQLAAGSSGLKEDGDATRLATAAVPQAVTALAPMVVQPSADAARARGEIAMAREVENLAAKHRADGFPVTEDLAEKIHEAASENDIDPEIAFGLIRAESSFKNSATSRVGAVGLAQLMPATANWLEPGTSRAELRDPDTNLRIGFKYLRQLIDKYEGDVDLALIAYNRGPGTVDRALKRGRNPDNGYADFVRTGKKGRHKG